MIGPTVDTRQENVEADLGQQAQTGIQARELYGHPLVQRFFTETENAIINGVKVTRPDDIEKREDFWRALKMLDTFKGMLMHYMDRGTAAERMLEDLQSGKFDGI